MTIREVARVVEGTIVCGEDSAGWADLRYAFASDLMSDVLTLTVDGVLLITGLASVQTIRTAMIADISCVLVARDKAVTGDMIRLADENHVTIIQTAASMFRSSGLLYEAGLNPVY